MTKAVIFDLDGTLVNTEPMYWTAWRKVLTAHDITLTDEDLHALMGRQPIESAQKLITQFGLDTEPATLTQAVIDQAIATPHREVMKGATKALELVRSTGLPVAIATSATVAMTKATLQRSGLDQYFEIVACAEHELYGKPHPAVFLTAAERLGVDPTTCTVIEDAPNGLIAAKAARMKCIAVPEHYSRNDPALGIADVVLDSLEGFTLDHL